jgi:hypothetical protein
MHPRVVPRDYDVLENGVVIGRIFMVPVAPEGPPLDVGERPQRRHTSRCARLRAEREAAMAAFAKSWRRA